MLGICRGPLWDGNLTWNTANPDLTLCMRDTFLVGVPCAWLWISGPLWLYNTANNGPGSFRWGTAKLLWAKLLLCLVLLGSSIQEFSARVERYGGFRNLYPSDIFQPTCLGLTYLLALPMTILEKRKRIFSSPPQFLFWLLLTLGLLPTFKVEVEGGHLPEDIFGIFTSFPAAFTLWLLNCFSDLDENGGCLAPEDKASFCSRSYFCWLDALVWKAFWTRLCQESVPKVTQSLNVGHCARRLLNSWRRHAHRGGVDFSSRDQEPRKTLNLTFILAKIHWTQFLLVQCLGLVTYAVTFLSPLFLKLLILFIGSREEETWKGYLFALLLFVVSVLRVIFVHQQEFILVQMTNRVRCSLVSLVLRKSLALSSGARKKYTSGELTNLVAVDCQRLLDCSYSLLDIWSGPYQILLAFIFLYFELGVAAFVGLGLMAFCVTGSLLFGKFIKKFEEVLLRQKDARMKFMSEILQGIKVLKLYAWEVPFISKVEEIRLKEIASLMKLAFWNSFLSLMGALMPLVVTLGVFGVYLKLDPETNELTPEKIFVCLSLFNLMKIPMTRYPFAVLQAIQFYVSLKRIDKFLNSEELVEEATSTPSSQSQSVAASISNGTFTWDYDNSEHTLKDVNIKIERGSLTAVVGNVGSGKSSLLSALLGDMGKLQGDIQVIDNLAYVPQEAWIQNMSVRDNILFTKPFEAQKYKEVLSACALGPDLKLLPSGDKTEIGENGINLSGGQKQRISLARAAYAESDIYLLDDPLSAVDAHVGKHIFERVISNEKGLLRHTTRVLVTNSVQFLSQVDQIIVMKNGKVVEGAALSEEVLLKEGDQASSLNEKSKEGIEAEPIDDYVDDDTSESVGGASVASGQGQLIERETTMVGRVKFSVYKSYWRKMGVMLFFLCTCLFATEMGFNTGSNYWLSVWADANGKSGTRPHQPNYYLGVYGALGLTSVGLVFLRRFLLFTLACKASRRIHKNLLQRIMHCPMSFFESNPSGRVLNRFSSDIDTIDQTIPYQINELLVRLFSVLFSLVAISYATPWFMTVILPILMAYVVLQQFFISTARQLQRLGSVTRSPILGHFRECISGVSSIRAYKCNERFVSELEERLATNLTCVYLRMATTRWLACRTSLIGNTIVLLSAVFAISFREDISAGLAGLSVTSAISIVASLGYLTNSLCQLETNSVALERVEEYCESEQESAWHVPEQDDSLESWPNRGEIRLQNFQAKYREDLDLALNGIEMEIFPEEKVGICGRTGSGKTTLTMALFRIVEPSGGSITIDGIDIHNLGLQKLRSRLTIIPQDPILFTGSLRFNLDPNDEHYDLEIWNALEQAHMKENIASTEMGLETQVEEGGQNFSVGQRQLLCLARALLRKTKILILDEATASIDFETDTMIQETIRHEFVRCTVLTVAHRLNTIADSDRIAVFSKGKLAEWDTPDNLLADPSSLYSNLVTDAGNH